jgi:hypothetical protein
MTNEEKTNAVNKITENTINDFDRLKKVKENGFSLNYKAGRARDRRNSKLINKIKNSK